MKVLSFLGGLAIGMFFMWFCFFVIDPANQVKAYTYFFGGAATGVMLTGVLCYFFMTRIIGSIYFLHNKIKRESEDLPYAEEVDDDDEDDTPRWMGDDPDWWRKPKKDK